MGKPTGPNEKRLRLVKAWQQIRDGNGTKADFDAVFVEMVDWTGYYRRPSYADWLARTKNPDGFELHSALSNARAEVVQHIMDFLTLDDEAMVALERAARAEGAR